MMENRCDPEQIKKNIETIRENVKRYAPSPQAVQLMAVTKKQPPEAVNAAWEAGVRLFGENRAQELRDRFDSYCFGAAQIHFIGALQSNKIKYLDGRVCCVQSVNDAALAKALSDRFAASPMDVCIEINVGGEESKSGTGLSAVLPLAEKIATLPGLRLRGLMCIPPPEEKPEGNRRYFAEMRQLFVDINGKNIDNINMDILSMGMSGDYLSAIKEGSTLIRIGTGIFGARI